MKQRPKCNNCGAKISSSITRRSFFGLCARCHDKFATSPSMIKRNLRKGILK